MIPVFYQPYFVLGVIVLLFLLIYKDILRPSVAFMLSMLVFMVIDILSYQDILHGLSNDKIASIILLVLITASLRKNFNLELIFDKMFKTAKTYHAFLLRMMTQVAILSSMINNTPVVALMTPYVFNWGKINKVSPSKLLIPLSFATIMGGMITVIGTSTTLLLNGFLSDYNEPLIQASDLLAVGLGVSITGILFMLIFANRLLPNNTDLIENFNANMKEFVVETRLTDNSSFIGKTVTEAELRNLKGVYLVEISRGDTVISPVQPDERIKTGDRLLFAGETEAVKLLTKGNKNIMLPEQVVKYNYHNGTEVVETVVSGSSSLIGRSVKEGGFRNRYDAAIVAIHRGGQKISGKIGDIQLQAGDLLLLYTGKNFQERIDLYRDLIVISTTREEHSTSDKKYYAIAVAALLIGLAAFLNKISLFPALLILFGVFIVFKMITLQDIKRELDLNMIAILVFSLGLGKAILVTNAGDLVAGGVLSFMQPYGLVAILVGLVLIANVLTSIIGNVGAVSICFPIAYALCQNLAINGMPFYLGVAFGSSATFITPISYQTNLIIYGPGGYNFKDFFKIGLPVTILYLVVALLGIVYLYHEVLI